MGLKINHEFDIDNDRGLTLTECDNINFLLYRDNYKYKSFYTLGYRKKNDKFHGMAGSICSIYDEEDDVLDELPKDYDIYICPNGMKTPISRSSDNLINIQNIVIDIDGHKSELSIDDMNIKLNNIEKEIIRIASIKPNFINYTGRGIQLWYCIEPLHVSLKKIVYDVIDMMIEELSDVLDYCNETELEIDKGTSKNLSGFFRFPYSYNTKSDTWAKGYLIHDEVKHANELRKTLFQSGYSLKAEKEKPSKSKKKKTVFKNYNYNTEKDWSGCIFHRKKFLEYLFQTGKIDDGRRHNALFMMYNILKQLYDEEDAQNEVIELNYSLSEPIPQDDLNRLFKSMKLRNKVYNRIKTETFLKYLAVTDDERAYFDKSTVEKQRREKKRQAKKEKYNKVIELYNQGMKKIDISKELNISRPTIDKIIRESA